jgi:hypothetical protein
MSWLTWRQHRVEALVAAVLLVLVLVVLTTTGSDLAATARALGQELSVKAYRPMPLTVIDLLPLLLGVFVGAPLIARELEQGTYRLVWTQGVTRVQWLQKKLALAGAATTAVFGLLWLGMTWWNRPVNELLGPWQTFEAQGSVIVAYALFSLALGLALGTLVRKTVPAMALVIPIFLVTRVGVAELRPVYLPPLQAEWDFSGENPQARDWILYQQYMNGDGPLFAVDPNPGVGEKTRVPMVLLEPCASHQDQAVTVIWACYHAIGMYVIQDYQPTSRFWLFQAIETGIYLALTAGLIVLTFWWVGRRIVS